jgi:sodium/bile acid cotransporter 7
LKLKHGFMWAMLAAVVLAGFRPELGSDSGALHLGAGLKFGIALLFFLNGASISIEKLKEGARNWQLHATVQACTYLYFPLLGVLVVMAAQSFLPPDLQLGILYLSVLSSAVSSSVAMTALARGNVSAAICSATLSTLLGLMLTPLWVSLLVHVRTSAPPLGSALQDIFVQLLLPFAFGQASRPLTEGFLTRHRVLVSSVDRAVILLIVYNAFCDSTQAGVWRENGWTVVLAVIVIDAILLAAILASATFAARRQGFDQADEAATVFCASKKSVINGIPMAKLIFGSAHSLGLILLPVMIYHQIQLIVCAFLARAYASSAAQAAGSSSA